MLGNCQAWCRAQQRPMMVDVTFSETDGGIETLEGVVSVRKGDAIVVGIKGERWPVPYERFVGQYIPAEGQVIGTPGRYHRIPKQVMACRLEVPIQVELSASRGMLVGQVGDWLVCYQADDFAIVAADIFTLTYELLAEAEE